MDKLEQIRQHLNSIEEDFRKFFEKGNHAAGTRLRKGMQDLKKLANEVRASVQEKKSSEKE